MGRSKVVAVLAALVGVLVGVPQTGAGAASGRAPVVTVQTLNFVFIPDPVKIEIGRTIKWFNPVNRSNHTATSDAPLSLWDSGEIVVNQSFSYTFTAGGIYPYTCTIHERFDMVSSVGVTDHVEPSGGPAGTLFTVTVATIPAPPDYVYDVQRKEPGAPWQDWQMGLTQVSVQFDSTGFAPGIYRFRSRLHRVSDGATSGYSPSVSITITSGGSEG
jgi:plastocyanin